MRSSGSDVRPVGRNRGEVAGRATALLDQLQQSLDALRDALADLDTEDGGASDDDRGPSSEGAS